MVIYGIKACDTMKRARAWLEQEKLPYKFHDYKVAGIDRAALQRWIEAVGWERLLNRAGATFRGLSETDRSAVTQANAVDLMLAHPTLIKRPVLEWRGGVIVGFRPETYAAALLR